MIATRIQVLGLLIASSLPTILGVEPDQLDIRLNADIYVEENKNARGNRPAVMQSIVTIEGLSGWNDEQVVDLAFAANQGMRDAYKRADLGKPPSVTTTLVVDNTAYISSSLKPGPFLYVEVSGVGSNQPRFFELDTRHPCTGLVQSALVACQTRSILGTGHQSGASCGEPMAALMFCRTNTQRNLDGARIVTVGGNTEMKIWAPCDGDGGPQGPAYPGAWGCAQFVPQLAAGMRVIPADTGRQATTVPPDQISVTWSWDVTREGAASGSNT